MPANSEQNIQNQLRMLQQQLDMKRKSIGFSNTDTNDVNNNISGYDMFFGSNSFNDFNSFCSIASDKENNPFDQPK